MEQQLDNAEQIIRLSFADHLANIEEERSHNVDLLLDEAAKAFARLKDPTPQDFSDYWSRRWQLLATRVPGLQIVVPDCDRAYEEIKALQTEGRTLIYKPSGITLDDLQRLHPDKGIFGSRGILSGQRDGWLDVTAQMGDIPQAWKETKKISTNTEVEKPGRFPMTLETFYIAAFDDCQQHDRSRQCYLFANYLLGTQYTDLFGHCSYVLTTLRNGKTHVGTTMFRGMAIKRLEGLKLK